MPSRISSPDRSQSNPKLSSSHARSYPIATSGAPGPRSCAIAEKRKPISATTIPIATKSGISAPDPFDLTCELEILGGQAPGIVRGQRDPHPLPPHVEIRMVVGLLGEEPDANDERDRAGKSAAIEGLDDLVALAAPAGQIG